MTMVEYEAYEKFVATEQAWEHLGVQMQSLPAAARRVNQWVKKRISINEFTTLSLQIAIFLSSSQRCTQRSLAVFHGKKIAEKLAVQNCISGRQRIAMHMYTCQHVHGSMRVRTFTRTSNWSSWQQCCTHPSNFGFLIRLLFSNSIAVNPFNGAILSILWYGLMQPPSNMQSLQTKRKSEGGEVFSKL